MTLLTTEPPVAQCLAFKLELKGSWIWFLPGARNFFFFSFLVLLTFFQIIEWQIIMEDEWWCWCVYLSNVCLEIISLNPHFVGGKLWSGCWWWWAAIAGVCLYERSHQACWCNAWKKVLLLSCSLQMHC